MYLYTQKIKMDNNLRNTNFNNFESATITNERSLFASVFTWMFIALGITTLCSLLFAYNPSLGKLLYNFDETGNNAVGISIIGWVCMLAPLALVLVMNFAFNKLPFVALMAIFFGYAALNGISFSAIFYIYNVESIGYIFGAAAGLFGLMAVLGYTTKTDLSKMGFYLRIGLLGVVIVALINLFARNSMIDTLISVACVIIFTGLTAFHVQNIKELSSSNDGSEGYKKLGVLGALSLYLAFINLFLALLRLFGRRD